MWLKRELDLCEGELRIEVYSSICAKNKTIVYENSVTVAFHIWWKHWPIKTQWTNNKIFLSLSSGLNILKLTVSDLLVVSQPYCKGYASVQANKDKINDCNKILLNIK